MMSIKLTKYIKNYIYTVAACAFMLFCFESADGIEFARNLPISELVGDWVVHDVNLSTTDGVQIDNKGELLGRILHVDHDVFSWPDDFPFLSKDQRLCSNWKLKELYPRSMKFYIVCGNGRLFGNYSEIQFLGSSELELSWFDNEVLILRRRK